ncbi:MarR family winged helix-turn-helix transcriptional regulator [Burkholderia glumae]|uniref:MarR family transcriptional regulator n=2 Tax=Burkholderia glumae TaxID=337 RepID=A0AAP9XVY7_BURGL|nr:MarR family transcriptional regulator [Burkholderia glumae]ACR31454.1 MarR family transcriptional regulator [Burkholderia glumae BGR1]KHJ64287.1 MarR family transcriptional regulator [Burkholderia glumae]MCM2485389.1 MarR family transcriptional regulator [Burkholderia glumae]MCM2495796.1 MarR family transcriptional regulator [Burkholderia glumae]MCM2511083.1 MarR family transcriptional regulator [Burkholderia glumae]
MTTKPRASTKKTSPAAAPAVAAAADVVAPGGAAPAAHAPMRLTYLIGQLDRIVSRRLTEVLAAHGLTLPQFTALSVLNGRGRSSNAQLAERSFITPQSANEVVKTMESNGWVTREPDPANRRIVLLLLTPAGKALLKRCNESVDQIERSMLGEMSADEPVLRALLHGCVKNLRER